MVLKEMRLFSYDYEIIYRIRRMMREIETFDGLEMSEDLKSIVVEVKKAISTLELELISSLTMYK